LKKIFNRESSLDLQRGQSNLGLKEGMREDRDYLGGDDVLGEFPNGWKGLFKTCYERFLGKERQFVVNLSKGGGVQKCLSGKG